MTAPQLSDPERAAVMVMLMEDEQAAAMLAQLAPEELLLLGEQMSALGDISPEAIIQAIAGFIARSDKAGLNSHDRPGQIRSLMTRAVGEIKAESVMQRILPNEAAPAPIELARWLTPQALIPLVAGEHPQTLAVLLVQIDPAVAAEVLNSLPPEAQAEVVHRIATLRPVSSEALAMLAELLETRISACHGSAALAMGGPREAAEIINNAGKTVEARVLPFITKADKALARQIENEMFKFEHLFALDTKAMGALLREVENDALIDALKGIDPADRERFLGAMSSRAADGVRDEIEGRSRLRKEDVEIAQKAIVAAARRLAADGTISFGSGGDEYV